MNVGGDFQEDCGIEDDEIPSPEPVIRRKNGEVWVPPTCTSCNQKARSVDRFSGDRGEILSWPRKGADQDCGRVALRHLQTDLLTARG